MKSASGPGPCPGRPPPPVPEPPPPRLDEVFGTPTDESRYLQSLPPIYQDQPFLGRFLLASAAVLTPIEQIVDNFDLYLDPAEAPPFFLNELAAWLGASPGGKRASGNRRRTGA